MFNNLKRFEEDFPMNTKWKPGNLGVPSISIHPAQKIADDGLANQRSNFQSLTISVYFVLGLPKSLFHPKLSQPGSLMTYVVSRRRITRSPFKSTWSRTSNPTMSHYVYGLLEMKCGNWLWQLLLESPDPWRAQSSKMLQWPESHGSSTFLRLRA